MPVIRYLAELESIIVCVTPIAFQCGKIFAKTLCALIHALFFGSAAKTVQPGVATGHDRSATSVPDLSALPSCGPGMGVNDPPHCE